MTRPSTAPRSRLERVRRGLTVFGAAMCALVLLQSIGSQVDATHVALSLAANVGVVAIVVFTGFRRDKTPILLIPLSAALALVTGIGLTDSVSVIVICIGLVVGQTMYGSRRSIVIRTACLLPVVPLSVSFSASPLSENLGWDAHTGLSALPAIPVFAGLMFLLRQGLESQRVTIARETFLGTLSSGLLAADTVEDITAVMVRANQDLVDLSPGLITLELQRIGPGEGKAQGGARLLNAHGGGGATIPELLSPRALTELPAFGVERSQPLCAGSAILTRLGLPPRTWYAIALERDPQAPCDLVLHGVQEGLGHRLFGMQSPEEQEFQGIIQLMSEHWRAAMVRVEQRAVLIEAEEQDDVTGLPDRSPTMRRIIELVHGGDPRVGLILLALGGLERVEVESGIAAADVAMNQLAYRIVEQVEDRGFAGRAGDASFAVVLTADSIDYLDLLVERLEAALTEPVLLPGGATTLSLRVGVARTTQDSTVVDLLDRAASSLAARGRLRSGVEQAG